MVVTDRKLDPVASGRHCNALLLFAGLCGCQRRRQLEAQVPDEPVCAGRARDSGRLDEPLRRDCNLHDVGPHDRVGTRIATYDPAGRVGDRQRRFCRRRAEHVVEHRPGGRVRAPRLVERHGRAGEPGWSCPDRGGGRVQARCAARVTGERPQRGHVIHDPESAPVGRDHEVGAVHIDVSDGGARQVRLQRLPMVAIVERYVDAMLGARIQQSPAHRILPHHVHRLHRPAIGEAIRDQCPGRATIARAIDIRAWIIDPVPVDGEIGDPHVVVGWLHDSDLRPGFHSLRRDVLPVRTAIGALPDKPVVGSRPQQACIAWRWADGIDDATTGIAVVVVRDRRRIERSRDRRMFATQVRADS